MRIELLPDPPGELPALLVIGDHIRGDHDHQLGAVLLQGVGAEQPPDPRQSAQDGYAGLAGALAAGDEAPIRSDPPSFRVRLVLICRFRMVGEPARLVAAVGLASLSCWEIRRPLEARAIGGRKLGQGPAASEDRGTSRRYPGVQAELLPDPPPEVGLAGTRQRRRHQGLA